MALQLSRPASLMLVPLLNIPSSGFVWRGPVPKIQVTPSASPSGWQDPQLLQASFDCLPRKFRGMMSRISVPKISLSGMPRRSEEHTSELQSLRHLVCRLLLEKKKIKTYNIYRHKKKNKGNE